MNREVTAEDVIETIKQSMMRDGATREFVDSIEHRPISELYPELMKLYRLKKLRDQGLLESMPPLRYEQLGLMLQRNC